MVPVTSNVIILIRFGRNLGQVPMKRLDVSGNTGCSLAILGADLHTEAIAREAIIMMVTSYSSLHLELGCGLFAMLLY